MILSYRIGIIFAFCKVLNKGINFVKNCILSVLYPRYLKMLDFHYCFLTLRHLKKLTIELAITRFFKCRKPKNQVAEKLAFPGTLGILLFACTAIHADEIQSLELLTNKIEQYIHNELSSYKEGKIQVSADKIDSRLNLKACAKEHLVVFNPFQSPILNTSTMGIKCHENDNHWSLYIPVKITVLKTIYVAKRALIKGNLITPDDIYQTEMDIQKLNHGYFTEKDVLIGQICKKNIPPNSPFNPYNIELAKLINKGERISIVAHDNNLTVSMDGIAVEEGSLGETIKVRNLSSNKIIEGLVSGKKKVQVVI